MLVCSGADGVIAGAARRAPWQPGSGWKARGRLRGAGQARLCTLSQHVIRVQGQSTRRDQGGGQQRSEKFGHRRLRGGSSGASYRGSFWRSSEASRGGSRLIVPGLIKDRARAFVKRDGATQRPKEEALA